jgi:hypothetical protein
VQADQGGCRRTGLGKGELADQLQAVCGVQLDRLPAGGQDRIATDLTHLIIVSPASGGRPAPATSPPARGVPMAAIGLVTPALQRPGHHMWHARLDLLVAAGAAVGLGAGLPGQVAHPEFALDLVEPGGPWVGPARLVTSVVAARAHGSRVEITGWCGRGNPYRLCVPGNRRSRGAPAAAPARSPARAAPDTAPAGWRG